MAVVVIYGIVYVVLAHGVLTVLCCKVESHSIRHHIWANDIFHAFKVDNLRCIPLFAQFFFNRKHMIA